jgi:hypothetical protein
MRHSKLAVADAEEGEPLGALDAPGFSHLKHLDGLAS